MAERLVLHIGSMKSGTSFIQNVLGDNKDRLAEQGVLFPGPRWKFQVKAVQDLIGHGGPDQDADRPGRPVAERRRRGERLAGHGRDLHGVPRPAQPAEDRPDPRHRFPDTDVEAVLTARDLARNIPAMWLESMQNGSTISWADYLDAVRTEDRGSPAGPQLLAAPGDPGDGPPLVARVWAAGSPW